MASTNHDRALDLQESLAHTARRVEEIAQKQLRSAEQQLAEVRSHQTSIIQLRAQLMYDAAKVNTTNRMKYEEYQDTPTTEQHQQYEELSRQHRIVLRELRDAKTGYGPFLFVFCLGALVAFVLMETSNKSY